MEIEVSLKRVKSYLQDAEIEIEKGQSYNIYTCGHVFSNTDDLPQTIHYYKKDDRAVRSCPTCGNKKLLTKYKKCTCGTEQTGKRVQPSQCCASCPTVLRNSGKVRIKSYKKRNGYAADPERCYCLRRDVCREEYEYYQTTPCKNCGGFIQGQGNVDPIYSGVACENDSTVGPPVNRGKKVTEQS